MITEQQLRDELASAQFDTAPGPDLRRIMRRPIARRWAVPVGIAAAAGAIIVALAMSGTMTNDTVVDPAGTRDEALAEARSAPERIVDTVEEAFEGHGLIEPLRRNSYSVGQPDADTGEPGRPATDEDWLNVLYWDFSGSFADQPNAQVFVSLSTWQAGGDAWVDGPCSHVYRDCVTRPGPDGGMIGIERGTAAEGGSQREGVAMRVTYVPRSTDEVSVMVDLTAADRTSFPLGVRELVELVTDPRMTFPQPAG